VKEELQKYLQFIRELDLQLVFALDTHVHTDHVAALGDRRATTGCLSVMGKESRAACASKRVVDGELLRIDGPELRAIDSGPSGRLLHLRNARPPVHGRRAAHPSTGRTDVQKGDPRAQYDGLFNKLLRLPDETLVNPRTTTRAGASARLARRKPIIRTFKCVLETSASR
jgi:glyoxylase-like metal-dependent hydrolase (beta-lactamase superfamily II)